VVHRPPAAECDESEQSEAASCTLLLRRIAAREEMLPLRLAPTLDAHRPSAETVAAVRNSLHEWQRQSCGPGVEASSSHDFRVVRALRRNHQDQLQALVEASVKAKAKAKAPLEVEADAGVVKPQPAVAEQPRAPAKHAPLKLAVTPRRPPSPPAALKRPGKIVIAPAHKEKENCLTS